MKNKFYQRPQGDVSKILKSFSLNSKVSPDETKFSHPISRILWEIDPKFTCCNIWENMEDEYSGYVEILHKYIQKCKISTKILHKMVGGGEKKLEKHLIYQLKKKLTKYKLNEIT